MYAVRKAREAGGMRPLWKALRSRNACKTCALGMGGQQGGMVNEAGHFPEVCKKSMQAMVADMQPGIDARFWPAHPLARLQSMSPYQLEHAGRLTQPVVRRRGADCYVPVDWETAFAEIAGTLVETDPEASFFYLSGRSSNEAAFLMQLLARLHGTNHVNNCSYYCHQASGVGLTSSIGSGTATVVLEDLDRADMVFVIGANPASNHPRLMTSLMNVRRRGGRVVVVNPIREVGLERFRVPSDVRSMIAGTRIASSFVQPRIGGDLALLTGVAKAVVAMGAHDAAFLEAHCAGVGGAGDGYLAALEDHEWADLEVASGVSRAEMEALAAAYASAERVIFSWAMGITHHENGTENVQAIANLALLRGMVGKPGAGLMPIRGHSNVQGIGSVGVTPRLKKAIFDGIEDEMGIELPSTPGYDTMACMEAAADGRLRVGVCLGGNLYGSNPDSAFARRSLEGLDTLVYLSTTLNTGHAHGLGGGDTWILPVLARDEEPAPTTQESMFNYVRLSDGGAPRHADAPGGGPRSEIDVIARLGQGMGLGGRQGGRQGGRVGRLDWAGLSTPEGIRQLIARVVPGYGAIVEGEFQIEGRTFHTPVFATNDGRARLHVHRIAAPEQGLTLMTIRSEGQFNTVVYEEEDLYRGVKGRDVVLLHPETMAGLGVVDGQRVRVTGPAGTMPFVRAVAFGRLRQDSAAMYFPEANVLMDRRVDPLSRTPAFKAVPVRIEPATAG